METEPMQRCDNCRQLFPDSKIATHFGYCRRNIKKCEVCGEMYDINSKEEHQEQFHKKQKCIHCKKQFSLADCKQHQQNCELKAKFCEYCELNVPVAGFQTHFKACQSRTKPCTKCNKPIMNKDYIVHIISCPGFVEQPKKPNNYSEYVNQVQKKYQIPTNSNNRINSRQKPQKPKQQRNYANIIRPVEQHRAQIKRIEPKVNIHYPQRQQQRRESKGPVYQRQQPKRQQIVHKREEIRQPIRQEYVYKKQQILLTKRQQPKKYSGIINAPPLNHNQKRQEPKPQAPISKPTVQYQNRPSDNARTSGSRQPARIIPTSNKQIGSIQPQSKQYPIKQAKSIERYNGIFKKQEQNKIKYANQNINPKRQYEPVRVQQNKYKVPVVQKYQPTKYQAPKFQVPKYQTPAYYQAPRQQQRGNQYGNHGYQFQMSPEEQQLQEIILQSMSEKNKTQQNGGLKNKNVVIPQKVPISVDIPYIQGQDLMNESFIEKQRAIQQQCSKNKARR